MRTLLFLGLGGVALLLSATVLTALPLGDLQLDLVLLILLYLAGKVDPISGGTVAFGLGYGMDLLSGAPFGTYTISKVIVFFAASLAAKRVYLTAGLAPAAAALVCTLFEALVIRILLRALGLDTTGLDRGYLRYLAFQALLMGALAPFAFHYLSRLDTWLAARVPGLDDRRPAPLGL
jgi:rod shape-determining protein MreD